MRRGEALLLRLLLAVAVPISGVRGDACLWAEPEAGLDNQCMGLGAAPGGRISRQQCEEYCCAHRYPLAKITAEDGVGTGGHCDLWQWAPPSELPDATYKWSCFIGVRAEDRGGAKYTCGKNAPDLAHVAWSGGQTCLGPAPSRWGAEFVLVFGLVACVYVGGGSAWGARVSGDAVHVRAHPHYSRWEAVHALCIDGVGFARGQRASSRQTLAGHREESRYHEAPSGAARDASRSHKSRRSEKKAKKEKPSADDGKTAPRDAADNTAPAAAADAAGAAGGGGGGGAAGRSGAPSVASGGGGRWVHIPT